MALHLLARRASLLGHAEVFAAICALSFLTARLLPVLELGHACPFRALTGLPCATCGMTRAFVAMAHGEVGVALGVSPLGALLASAGWLFALADVGRLLAAKRWPALPAHASRLLAFTAAGALLVNWAWLLLARGA